MSEDKTEEITVDEYIERSEQAGRKLPLLKAEGVCKIFRQDGTLKSTFHVSTEELDNET